MKGQRFVLIVAAVVLAGGCATASKRDFTLENVEEKVRSNIQFGMSPGEVHKILGEPSSRSGSHIASSAEWRTRADERMDLGGMLGDAYVSECWIWGQRGNPDAVICFGPSAGVVYKSPADQPAR